MMMGKVGLRGVAAVLSLGLAGSFAGCSCEGGVKVPGEVRLSFEFPADRAVLAAPDDVDATADGLQVDVRALAVGFADGSTVALTNSLTVDATGVPVPVNGSVAGGQVVFAGYTVPEGDAVVLRVSRQGVAFTEVCDGSNCAEVRVRVVNNVCLFVTPLKDDVLTADAYPDGDTFDPFETDVTVECRGVAEGDYVALAVNGARVVVAQVDAALRATFARVRLSEGSNSLAATSKTDAAGANAQGATTTIAVEVETSRCQVSLYPGDGRRFLFEDDPDLDSSNGMQATFDLVTDCAATSTVSLHLRAPGATSDTLVYEDTPTANTDPIGTRFRITGVDLPESVDPFDVHVIAQVEESATVKGYSLRQSYWVDSIPPPELESSLPRRGECVDTADDSDVTAPGMQIDFAGAYQGAANGTIVYAHALPTGGTATVCTDTSDCSGSTACIEGICRYSGTVTDGTVVIRDISLPSGPTSIQLYGVDPAGNQGELDVVQLQTIDRIPQVTIQKPAADTILTELDDINDGEEGIQSLVEICATDVIIGATGVLETGGISQNFTPLVPDGCREVQTSFFAGENVLEGSIQPSCGAAGISAPVTIRVLVELEVAVIAQGSALADGAETAVTTVDLSVTSGTGAFNSERSLVVRVTDSVGTDGAGDRICNGSQLRSTTRIVAAEADSHLVLDEALAAGVNCFELTLLDGIASTGATVMVRRRVAAPMPTITDPTGLVELTGAVDSTGTIDDGFHYSIVVALAQADTANGTMELDIGGIIEISASVLEGATGVTFADVGLHEGTYTLTPTYRDDFGLLAVGDPVTITVNTGGLPIVLTAPAPGATTSSDSLVVTVALSGTDVPVRCDILVDDLVVLNDTAWTSGTSPMIFPAVVVAEGSHRVVAECTTATATGRTPEVTYRVDQTDPPEAIFRDEVDSSVPPLWGLRFDAPPPTYVNSFVPDSSAAPGLHHDITWQLDAGTEDPTGWSVALSVTPSGGSTVVYTTDIFANTPTMNVTVPNVEFGAVQGEVLFSLTVTDAAGNTKVSDRTLTVDTVLPELVQTTPDPTERLLTRKHDLTDADFVYVDLRFDYTTVDMVGDLSLTVTGPQTPANYSSFPITADASSGTVSIPTAPADPFFFADGIGYLVTAVGYDVAGNRASMAHVFQVSGTEPRALWNVPADPVEVLNMALNTAGTPGFWRGTLAFLVRGFDPGTQARLCSSVDPGGAPTCAGGGFIIATTSVIGTIDSAGASFSDQPLAETNGTQVQLYAEISAGVKEASSLPRLFHVDSIPPTVDGLAIAADGAPTGLLNAAELTSGQVSVRISVTGADGEMVELLDNGLSFAPQAMGLLLGGATDILVTLAEGGHDLTAMVSDGGGNPSSGSPTLAIIADYTPPTVAVPAATKSPYNGSDDQVPTPVARTPVLELDFNITASDNRDLNGTTVEIERVQDLSGTPFVPRQDVASFTFTNAGTDVANIFSDYPLQPGSNFIMASITDAAGNSQSSTVRQYDTDLYGPILTLGIYEASGSQTTGCGDTDANYCIADILDPLGSNVAMLDETAAGTYCPPERAAAMGVASCPELGTDLYIGMSECQSVASLEDCQASPINIVLESESVGTAGVGSGYTPVATFTSAQLGNPNGIVAPTPVPGGLSFPPSNVRRVRLRATDSSGNESVTQPVYLGIYLTGLSITLVRVDQGGVEQEDLATTPFIGLAQSETGEGTPITADLRVILTPEGAPLPPAPSVILNINGAETTVAVSGDRATFDNVQFASVADLRGAGGENTILLTVTSTACGGDCAAETINIRADHGRPVYQFDRADLCTLAVPMDQDPSTGTCTKAAAANATPVPADAISGLATWNDNVDTLGGTPGFQPAALTVLFSGIENGRGVVIHGGTGNPVPGGNTSTTSSCATETIACAANFTALSLTSLTDNAAFYQLSVEARDTAGNLARAARDVPGGSDCFANLEQSTCDGSANCSWVAAGFCAYEGAQVRATTDTDLPGSFSSSLEVCSYPGQGGNCAAICGTACDRQAGSVMVGWDEPVDDALASNGLVAGYQIQAVAAHVDYSGALQTDCSNYVGAPSDPVDVGLTIPSLTPAAAGQLITAQLTGLLPHRRYCVFVQALDDVGNASVASAGGDVPLLAFPTPAVSFEEDVAVRDDGAVTPVSTGPWMAHKVVNLGNIDDHPGDDFAISVAFTSPPGPGADPDITSDDVGTAVWVYLSGSGTPAVPAIRIRGVSFTFGLALVSGYFNDDDIPDLAIADPHTVFVPLPATSYGAVFIFYGTGTASGFNLVSNVHRSDCTPVCSPGALIESNLPGYVPDLSLLGVGAPFLGISGLLAGNIDNTPVGTDDLVIISANNEVGGFLMSPTRFVVDGQGRATLALAQPPGTDATSYDFTVVRTTSQIISTGTMADVDGDGRGDIVLGSPATAQVWIFDGARIDPAIDATLTMSVDLAPDRTATPVDIDPGPGVTLATPPLNRLLLGDGFGTSMHRIPAPGGNTADWLAVYQRNASLAFNHLLVFKGRGSPTYPGVEMPQRNSLISAGGVCDNAAYATSDLDVEVCLGHDPVSAADYAVMPLKSWKNEETPTMGFSMAARNDFLVVGRFVLTGPGDAGFMVMKLRYEQNTDVTGQPGFLRNAILRSPADAYFGQTLLLLDGYLDSTSNNLQIGVGSPNPGGGAFYLYD